METILLVIIGVLLLGILISVSYIFHIKRQTPDMDYDSDIRYLNVCIDRETKFYISIELESQQIIIGTETFRNIITDITKRVTVCLSTKYLKTLSLYFSGEGLQAYIFQVIFSQVLPYCVENNSMKEYFDSYEDAQKK